jgi:hypothetical protein
MLNAQEIKFIDSITSRNENQLIEDHEQADEFDFFEQLEQSNIIRAYASTYFYKSFQINNIATTAKLFFVQASYIVYSQRSRYHQNELHLIGVKKLSKNYGEIEIRPEKIKDKINELIHPTEIDFEEFPKFSRKYFMLASNQELAKDFASKERIRAIENHKDLFIEIRGNLFIAKFARIVDDSDFNSMMKIIESV